MPYWGKHFTNGTCGKILVLSGGLGMSRTRRTPEVFHITPFAVHDDD